MHYLLKMAKFKKIVRFATVGLMTGTAYFAYDRNVFNVKDKLEPCFQSSKDPLEGTNSQNAYEKAIEQSRKAIRRVQTELGVPGIVVGVSLDGKAVWKEGFGMVNVETQTPCHSETKMRIASISKPFTMALLGKLVEKGLVDLDKPIQEYVPYFPEKNINNKKMTVTPRLVACHMSGIRHYKKNEGGNGDDGPEFYLKERFENLNKALNLFKDDELLFEPGKKFLYTTHGYTLLSAVIEGAMSKPFHELFSDFFKQLGLLNTHLDEISPLIYERSSYYVRKKNGKLHNAELTDNSYKWAGGGLVSNVEDLLMFANMMLASYQNEANKEKTLLQSKTVQDMWTPRMGPKKNWGQSAGYGMGWNIVPEQQGFLGGKSQKFQVGHSGGAVGASSILLIFPGSVQSEQQGAPKGIAVAVLGNLQNISFYKLAYEIVDYFEQAQANSKAAKFNN